MQRALQEFRKPTPTTTSNLRRPSRFVVTAELMKMLILLPLVGIFFNSLPERAEANILLGYKSLRHYYPANCTVGNTTYAHGQTFKLDCKTQCVCENGRHACSSLCPKEQLPAPEDTISCRSPRLVEVPGHCCKMWLCENPTADVTATCQNSSTSPWTACSRNCGIGLSTRVTSTTRGCHKLSNIRLCEQRRCDQDDNNQHSSSGAVAENFLSKTKDLSHSIRQQLNLVHKYDKQQSKDISKDMAVPEHEHRIRKGHECRHIQRLGPARIRLGPCVSRKLYRPKLCGRCQRSSKCCVPSVSTTIQVELLCPLKANDPISYVAQGHQQHESEEVQHRNHHSQQYQHQNQNQQQLWDTVSLEPIDQEFLQSHQIQIENKFIAVEWILKCECSRNEYCNDHNNNIFNYYNYSDNVVNIASSDDNNNMIDKSFLHAEITADDDDTTNTEAKENNNSYQQQHYGDDSNSDNNYSNNNNYYAEAIARQQQEQQQQRSAFASRT